MQKKTSFTLHDVAASAGVGVMTVSRVINRSAPVSEATRGRVEVAIRRLGYRPNALARGLRAKRSGVIGVLVSDLTNPFSGRLIGAFNDILRDADLQPYLCLAGQSDESERQVVMSFLERRVDGLIVATHETPAGVRLLRNVDLPLVTIGWRSRIPKAGQVTAQFFDGGRKMVEHLIARGHRRIGFLGSSYAGARRLSRFAGYLAAMAAHDLAVDPRWVVGPREGPAYSTLADGYAGMKTLLALSNGPTAVFARNDSTAMGAQRATLEAGLRIPEDMAIAGFDDIPEAAYASPPLSSVRQPIIEQGREAALCLVGLLKGERKRFKRRHEFPCELVLRRST